MFLPCGYETESHSLDTGFSDVFPQTIDSTLAFSSSDSVSYDCDYPVFNSDIELPSSPLELPVLSEMPLPEDAPSAAVPNIALPTRWSGVSSPLLPTAEPKGMCDSASLTCKERWVV